MSVLMYLFVGIKFKKYKIPNIPPYPLTEQGIQGDIIRKRKEIMLFSALGQGEVPGNVPGPDDSLFQYLGLIKGEGNL